jgi:hypothetical protein
MSRGDKAPCRFAAIRWIADMILNFIDIDWPALSLTRQGP